MRIADTIIAPIRANRRQLVRGSGSMNFKGDNDNRPTEPQTVIEVETIAHAPAQSGWGGHSSAYIAQFIHQELLPKGRNLDQSRDAAQKYQKANENLEPSRRIAKISV